MPYYAVAKGNIIGIFDTWNECQISIHGFSGAKFKKFNTKEEAESYILNNEEKIEDIPLPINAKLDNENTEYIKVYTDGSCIRKGFNSFAGYGIYIPEKNIKKSYVLEGKKTNNRGELSAIIESIKLFNEDKEKGIHIYTDSEYSIKIFTETGEKYRLKNYKRTGNKEYPNTDLIKELLSLKQQFIIKFSHINSHTGREDEHSVGNDIADGLAVKGAVKDYISSLDNIGDNVITFGKHKGNKLNCIDTKYLKWVLLDNKFESLCVKNEQLRLEKELVKKYLETIL